MNFRPIKLKEKIINKDFVNKKINLSFEDERRQKNIISKLNLNKLPFDIPFDKICDLNLEMARHSKLVLRYEEDRSGLKWVFSSIKKYKVFLVIFEANELGLEIYKEKISSKLPEYSYKTIAQIIDEGVSKKFFLKLKARANQSTDLKIRNVRPSEDLIIEFVNWKIELLASVMKFQKDFIN
jgi:N12 class adenine-specific DNA methylase